MKKVVLKTFWLFLLLIPFIVLSQEKSGNKSDYPDMIGDIEFDAKIDNPNFEICNERIYQYFNNSGGLEYTGEKYAIEKEFYGKYKSKVIENESGLIRIRFVVNCKGETDRFRIIGMNEKYEEKTFDKSITNQLLEITKSLKGWKPKKLKEVEIDYYQFLIFKIENGKLKEILP